MKCPHCRVEIHPAFTETQIQPAPLGSERFGEVEMPTVWNTHAMVCPACKGPIIGLTRRQQDGPKWRTTGTFGAYPQKASREAAAPEVPSHLAEDFNEAGAVLGDSPKASAALSRRCLQALLHDQGFKQHDLGKAIDALLASRTLPSPLAINVDAVRNIGNFAAHPQKDTNSGAIFPVEEHEAEWNLEVLEGLFDFYYVQAAKDAARRAALNAKLQAAGKAPIK